MKRDKVDALFSKLIRLLADGNCQRCNKHLGMKSFGLHCAHWFSRAKKNIRWDRYNAASLCYGCHRYLDTHPLEKTEFFIKIYGQEQFKRLLHLNNHPEIKIDKDKIYEELKEKVRLLEK
jgi:hypothetical protein